MMKVRGMMIISFLVLSGLIKAQETISAEFQSDAWEIQAKKHQFKKYKGQQALYLENGKARLKNSSFKEGIIEYDVSFTGKRNFVGVHFRIQDTLNYEEYYLRPHQSGNEDSMQYTPVINGDAGWQLYTGEGHWAAFAYRFGEWMHVKLNVSGGRMDVFIDDMETPILHVDELKLKPTAGALGFGTFLGDAYYANLSYRELENPALVTTTTKTRVAEKGTILDWEVSNAFASEKIKSILALSDLDLGTYRKIKPEPSGTVNLSTVSPISEATNTVVARFSVQSDSDQIKELQFGYSDIVTVFVNGTPVYSGNNSFRTRDYRYLGSLGYFDAIYLNLKKGANEIAFAVTERMGGWGIKAKMVRD
ncbi:MAG: hypothetical protein AAFO99_04205 [Bacteroidota bacterium]